MALEPKTKKIIIISVIALVAIALAYLAYQYFKSSDTPVVQPPGSTTIDKPGLADTATKYFCMAFPNSKICGGAGADKPVKCVNGCDENHYGRDCNGFLDPTNCGAG